ncbi:MAG: hypothetical protein HC887_03435 [Desulfobacteraceae bacterium]|nr:hypothetical protein [Desulfobacteraceae bacterium]
MAVSVMILSFFQGKSLIHSLRTVIQGLRLTYEQVASAADDVSAAGRQLAEGTSRQTASLQGTASSLGQVGRVTRKKCGKRGAGRSDCQQFFSEHDRRQTFCQLPDAFYAGYFSGKRRNPENYEDH